MKVVAIMDSFKESLSSRQAGAAVAEGVRRVYPDAEVVVRPLADGGEGTVATLAEGCGGEEVSVRVSGPLGTPVDAVYAILPGKVAVIEMSAAAGIALVAREERNPWLTTTYGVGELIRDAIFRGCRDFIVGIGGSATNDGGVGMLEALGFGMLDRAGEQVARGAQGLSALARITDDGVLPALRDCRFRIACDVVNPLCGPEGCSAVYGPQKGAIPAMIREMDSRLADYAALTRAYNPKADPDFPGAGAAGGLGFAFLSYLSGELCPGISLILRETRAEEYIREADIVVTGEGRLDGQTAMGKAPIGVAALAKKHGKPVVAFSGCVTDDATKCNGQGIDAFFPILRSVTTLEEALDVAHAHANLADTAEQVFRLVRTLSGS